jgi:hypothetical protein
MPSRTRVLVLASLTAALTACGGSLADECTAACRHLYRDCLTGAHCQDCAHGDVDSIGEAACEADCATRPVLCGDPSAVYHCLSGLDCASPGEGLLSACYAKGGCDTLRGGDDQPVHSFGSADSFQVHVELDATDAQLFACGEAVSPYVIVDIKSALAPIKSGRFALNTDASSCSGACASCPADAGACASIAFIGAQDSYAYVTLPTTGTVDIAAYDGTHVAGTFDVGEALPDGGFLELLGTFDAPSCLVTPGVPPPPPSCGGQSTNQPIGCESNGEGWGDAVFPGDFSLWLVAVYRGVRSWRSRRGSG